MVTSLRTRSYFGLVSNVAVPVAPKNASSFAIHRMMYRFNNVNVKVGGVIG